MKEYLFTIFSTCSDSGTAVISWNDVEQRTFIFEKGYLVKEWLRGEYWEFKNESSAN